MSLREMIVPAVAVVRVPSWRVDYQSPGWYWGWRHSVQIGPWLIFWGRMSEAEIERAMEAEGR